MSKFNFTDEQITYMENAHEFVQGSRCYELELPWMDKDAIYWLYNNLKPEYNCLEFGSGGSTLFFNKLVGNIDTYEADKNYYNFIKNNNTFDNINYNYVSTQAELISNFSNLKEKYYDVCVVDIGNSLEGRNREEIFLKSIPKMKNTTIYVLDNGFSELHYTNIWKWKEPDFQKILGNHYKMADFDNTPFNKFAGTRILYPN